MRQGDLSETEPLKVSGGSTQLLEPGCARWQFEGILNRGPDFVRFAYSNGGDAEKNKKKHLRGVQRS